MAATENAAARTLVAADRRGILALWGANGVSALGGQMTNVAIPWFMLETTGSAAKTGLVATAIIAGGVVSAGLSGPAG